ncbi:MAG: phosphonate metabolism transcriptional regulator PhnF [Mesorhizobium sp.]|nr:phosphonate metabolism transcriptional regulator PhnF [Mesorhizobium sp.]MBL8580556.1 phosphonate metabolism transcriptional regulator PhnF [Mesorhizobium sp.]
MAGVAGRVERRSGISLWRQIADQIRQAIGSGEFDEKLPPEMTLAERFGVNRHTVRGAISALVQEGVLRAEQGRGTFIERKQRLAYPIGARTRFSEGLQGQAKDRRGILLAHAIEPADQRTIVALGLTEGDKVVRLETLSEADGRPISRATSFFPGERFPGIEKLYAQSGSVTTALKSFDVVDYFRRSTLISARHASDADLADLRLSPGAIVIATVYTNVDPDERPIQFSETRFAADLVELSVS